MIEFISCTKKRQGINPIMMDDCACYILSPTFHNHIESLS